MSKRCEFLLCNNHEGSIPSSRMVSAFIFTLLPPFELGILFS